MSESVQRKAKDYFYVEIAKDEKKLVSAASKGKTEMVIRLLSTNMLDINRIYYEEEDDDDEGADYDMSTPLLEAANNGHTEIVQVLLDRGAKPNISNEYGYNPLQIAASRGYKEVVRLLIGGGANPNTVGEGKSTPLHGAAAEGHKDVVQMLLDEEADLNVEDKGGYTPFYMAFEHDHKDVEQLLLEKGAKPHKKYYEWELLKAIEKGDAKEVKRLFYGGVDANYRRYRIFNHSGRKPQPQVVAMTTDGAIGAGDGVKRRSMKRRVARCQLHQNCSICDGGIILIGYFEFDIRDF